MHMNSQCCLGIVLTKSKKTRAWPQVYGYQGIKCGTSSEQIVGRCLADTDTASLASPLVIGTKFFTIPWTNFLVGGGWRLGKASILEALKNSLQRVGSVDLYQVGTHSF